MQNTLIMGKAMTNRKKHTQSLKIKNMKNRGDSDFQRKDGDVGNGGEWQKDHQFPVNMLRPPEKC